MTEQEALTRIAAALGARDDWSPAAELLEFIAATIGEAAPHPGDPRNTDSYRQTADFYGVDY